MATNFDTDVLICGAGAAGLTLAVDLARRGVAFRLIDKAEGPFPGSRGKGIQPRGQEVLEDLGVLDRIAGAGGSYPPQRTYGGDGFQDTPVMDELAPAPDEPYRTALLSPQFLTEAALRERLAELGQAPAFGFELKGFDQDADGVDVRLDGGAGEAALRVRYLVGADGGRSFVRQALGIGFPGETLGVRAIVADVEIDGLGQDVWHRWGAAPGNQIAVCPLAGTGLFQLQAPIPLEGDVDLSAEGLSVMLADRSGRSDLVVRSVAWASAYVMSARLADRYRVGRVFLAGDAAHVHPPTGGQGLNTSLQDAYNLGWKLAAVLAGAPATLLDSYEIERRPIAAGVLGLSTGLLKAAQAKSEMRRGRDTQQLDLGYPDSPLSLSSLDGAAILQAGDRAPDAPCRGAGGQPTRLFALFQGPHWTLLGYAAAGAAPIPARPGLRIHRIGDGGDIVDDGGHIQSAYGLAPGDWVLVRPDGYVGAIIASGQAPPSDAYLAGVGL